jgi:hypothetical protein
VKTARKPPKEKKPLDVIHERTNLVSLDVSSSAIGWAQFWQRECLDFGLIKKPSRWESSRRIKEGTKELRESICGLDMSRTHVVLEWQSYKSTRIKAQGLAVLGQAQGFVWCMLEELGLPVDLVSEREWTRWGGSNATKETRYRHIKSLCPDYAAAAHRDENFDVGRDIADAIGIGIWRLSFK